MIIQCEKCQTRFRLDDSRVADKGVKVRCTKCKYVFMVHKEGSDTQTLQPGAVIADTSTVAAHEEPQAAPSENWSFAPDPAPAATTESIVFEEPSQKSEPAGFSPFDTSTFDASEITFDTGEDSIPSAENNQIPATEPSVTGGEVDFSGFDFGESDAEPEPPSQTTLSVDSFTESAAVATAKEAPQGLDFSDDDMFGAVVQAAPETSTTTISFDFEGDSFAESMDMNAKDAGGKGGNPFSLDTPGDTPFNLGEIDFGDELTSVAVQQVNPDDLKPSQEILFAPLAEAKTKSADDVLVQSFLSDAASSEQQELPPLSIQSRRKQSPVFGVLIAIVALLVISVLGYLGYSSLSDPKEAASPEQGRISVKGVTSTFIDNAAAGELLVVSGEAFNEYSKPRAALQFTVTVFDAAGQSVATKSAYGGNPLTEEQVETLPLDKIEAAMANQFGDSLANMEVASGKSIPFVVVLANLPPGAKDFAVQSSGSTVATGKQQ